MTSPAQTAAPFAAATAVETARSPINRRARLGRLMLVTPRQKNLLSALAVR